MGFSDSFLLVPDYWDCFLFELLRMKWGRRVQERGILRKNSRAKFYAMDAVHERLNIFLISSILGDVIN